MDTRVWAGISGYVKPGRVQKEKKDLPSNIQTAADQCASAASVRDNMKVCRSMESRETISLEDMQAGEKRKWRKDTWLVLQV